MKPSRPKFYELSLTDRLEMLAGETGVPIEELRVLNGINGLNPQQSDHMIENAIGVYGLPLGVARNFLVNGREVVVPMAIEEPSVVAAVSFMARLVRSTGGFTATSTPPEMIGQLQLLDIADLAAARDRILAHSDELLALAGKVDPVLSRFGGGPRGIEVREIHESPIGPFLVLHLIYDVRDAMGANAINTALEQLAPRVAEISGGRPHLRILSNLADRRLARAECTVPLDELGFDTYSPEAVRDGIIEAWAFAAADPYRAATHNKGIMNGVDAVVIATGNDWRAVEAGAHAYAARGGRYTSLSTWEKDDAGNLTGWLEMPMAVGIIGTTIAPWMQFYLQSSVVDKGLKTDDYPFIRIDVIFGSVMVNVIAFFIIMLCAVTLFQNGIRIDSAKDAAQALAPLAGEYCSWLFAFGLLNASLFAASILPISTAYTICEAFGWESSLNCKFIEAPQFYGLYSLMVLLGAAVILLPDLPLIGIMYYSQVINGLLLPFILIFMLLLINDRRIMGEYVNRRFMNVITWATVILLILLSGTIVVTSLIR